MTGWGATASHGQVSNKLQEVRVPILSNEACRKTGYGGRITDNMLCAGFSHGTKDSCQVIINFSNCPCKIHVFI